MSTDATDPTETARRDFLHGEYLSLSVRGAHLQRREKVFASELSDKQRTEFQGALFTALGELAPLYAAGGVDDDTHVDRIEALAEQLSGEYGRLLSAGQYRIGTVQKALNLYLKYLWCSGWVAEPPHCPFDSFVIEELKREIRRRQLRYEVPEPWTKVNSVSDYRKWVVAARAVAGEESLPCWELRVWNDRAGLARRAFRRPRRPG